MAPEWEKLPDIFKTANRDDIVIARLEANTNEEIAIRYRIPSFPLVAYFAPNDRHIKAVFQGERRADVMTAWIKSLAPLPQKLVQSPDTKNNSSNIKDKSKIGSEDVTTEVEELKKELIGLKTTFDKLNMEIEELKAAKTIYVESKVSSEQNQNDHHEQEIVHIKPVQIPHHHIFLCLAGLGLVGLAGFFIFRKLSSKKKLSTDIESKENV